MDLRVLNYFVTVAKEKTITKAAAVLHLSQPTLSKQLKELEEELGAQLFIRGSREITLTEAGRYLLNRSKEILALVNTTTANLRQHEVIAGTITVGGGETQAFSSIAKIMDQLIRTYPEISLQLYSGNADDLKEKLDLGLLDFGLVIDPVDKRKYDALRLPMADRWGILVNEAHPLAEKKQIRPEDLLTERLLISNQSQVDNQLAEWLGGNLQDFTIIGTYNLLYNASLLVKEGMCVALCIDGIINTENSGLRFIPFEPALTAPINLIWKREQVFSAAGQVFLEKVRGVYR